MIVGFVCPMDESNVTFEECLACAAGHHNECAFDYPILAGMHRNIRRSVGISVSSLLNCLRKVVLEARRDVYLPLEQLYYAFRGQLFHAVIAGAQEEGAVVEQRFERTVAGIALSGHPDVVYPQLRKLVDYKSTRRVPKGDAPYANHAIQVNLYRYLVAPQYEVDELEIVYLDMNRVKRVPVEVMTTRQLMGWLVPRLKVLKAALEGGKLPKRVASEGVWQCDGYCPFTDDCWPKGCPSPGS